MFGGDSAVVIHPMAGLIAHPCCRADISRKPVYPCFARLIGPEAKQFEQVVAGADERPLAVDLLQSPYQELLEAPTLLDLAEDRRHRCHAYRVTLATPPGCDFRRIGSLGDR